MSDIINTGKSTHESQDCIEGLLAQLSAERKLRAEFEEWLDKTSAGPRTGFVQSKYRELKAKYLQNKSASKDTQL